MNDNIQISLKAARVNAGLTQSEAAERLGINRLTLNSWENGKVIPRTPFIMAMSQVYGIPVDNIFLPLKTT